MVLQTVMGMRRGGGEKKQDQQSKIENLICYLFLVLTLFSKSEEKGLVAAKVVRTWALNRYLLPHNNITQIH